MGRNSGAGVVAAMLGMWLLSAVVSLAVTGGVIYVAIHFIKKLW